MSAYSQTCACPRLTDTGLGVPRSLAPGEWFALQELLACFKAHTTMKKYVEFQTFANVLHQVMKRATHPRDELVAGIQKPRLEGYAFSD